MKPRNEWNKDQSKEISWDAPAGLFVRLLAVERLEGGTVHAQGGLPHQAHWLLVLKDGCFGLSGEGWEHQIEAGSVYLSLPGDRAVLRQQSSSIQGLRVVFELLEPQRSPDEERDGGPVEGLLRLDHAPSLPGGGLLSEAIFSEVVRLVEALSGLRQTLDALRAVREQLLLQELLLLLLERQAAADPDTVAPSLDAAIRMMERDVGAPLTREMLASQAGMSVWHFSHRFKSRLGVGPMEYLGHLRLHKAKERLLQSRLPIKDIAKEVGFADEFYFSRKFKQATGMPPSVYVKQSRDRIAALSFPYTGHLLALGVTPWAGTVDLARDAHREPHLSSIRYHLRRDKQSSPAVWQYNNRILQEARPEIILCSEWEAPAVGDHVRAHTPQVIIPWTALDWRGQFRRIAEAVGQEQRHAEWLDHYESQVHRTAGFIREAIGDATVSLLHILSGRLAVYGRRNGGAVLYGDLGLHAPYRWDTIEVCQEVSMEQLPEFTGEYLILIVDPDPSSLRVWEKLRQSEVWHGLEAVRCGRVYRQPEMPWLDYSPFAHEQLLQAAERLFSSRHDTNV